MPERGRCGECKNWRCEREESMGPGWVWGFCEVLTRVGFDSGDGDDLEGVTFIGGGCYPVADGGWYVKKEA